MTGQVKALCHCQANPPVLSFQRILCSRDFGSGMHDWGVSTGTWDENYRIILYLACGGLLLADSGGWPKSLKSWGALPYTPIDSVVAPGFRNTANQDSDNPVDCHISWGLRLISRSLENRQRVGGFNALPFGQHHQRVDVQFRQLAFQVNR